jgi:SAM-dependent methyltransferase
MAGSSMIAIKDFLKRILPRGSRRRLCAALAVSAITQPHRFHYRLNRQNVFLHRQFYRSSFKCCVCEEVGRPYFDMPDRRLREEHGISLLRETLMCAACRASMRQRTLATVLLSEVGEKFGVRCDSIAQLSQKVLTGRVLDADSFGPISARLHHMPGYVRSVFKPQAAFGKELEPGLFNINLEAIDFESNSFDLIMTSDVMEHVRNDVAAHREIFRCLRPGGAYIFTVPYIDNMLTTRYLVDTSTDADIYLCTPHIHEDPLTGGILAYRIYGRELMEDLSKIGFEVQFRVINRADSAIFQGDIFVARKPSSVSGT